MEGHCATGKSPQWAVVPMEEEENEVFMACFKTLLHYLLWVSEKTTNSAVRVVSLSAEI